MIPSVIKLIFPKNTSLNTVNSTYTYRAYLHETAVHTSVHTAFLNNKHTKSTHKTITQFLCPIFKDIKDWQTHKMNNFKNNNIQIRELIPCLFEKKIKIRLYTVRV